MKIITQKTFAQIALVLTMICVIAFASPLAIHSTGLDGLNGGSTDSGSSNSSDGSDNAMADYLKGYEAVTSDNMQKASTLASPIANAIGTLTGFIMIVISAGIFLVTALDLAYIGIPFLRPTLDPTYGQSGGSPMGGGMGMGGMGGMGMGGMMGGGMGGQAQQPQGRVWISDEAKACVAQAGGAGGQAGGMMPGGGMGMGGMGMGGMGGMMGGMGGQQQQQQMPTKSIIFMYLKKRMFFLIIFALASVILMSSVFTDCGINLAALLTKVMNRVNGSISNVEI